MDFHSGSMDAIITSATAHHLPYEWLLSFAKEKLRKGGRLLILDLAKPSSIIDYIVWGLASPANIVMNLIKNRSIKKGDEHSKALWDRHGGHDTYMKLNDIRRLSAELLPGSVVKRRLFWRYILTWTKEYM